jgi:uncharacterized protein (TIGR03435 family)
MSMAVLALAQSSNGDPQHPTYEVASIKPSVGTGDLVWGASFYGALTARNAPVSQMIQFAYGVRFDRILGVPSWMADTKYDISAKAPKPDGAYSVEQTQSMLQALLADRFKLKVHREAKQMSIYALVIASGGPKLTVSRKTNCFDATLSSQPLDIKGRPGCGSLYGRRGDLHAMGIRMLALSNQLERFLDRPVMDNTGLREQEYDIELRWTPTETANPPSRTGDSPTGGLNTDPLDASDPPSLFTALREQLGLRLESSKGAVEVLIVDHIGAPSEN